MGNLEFARYISQYPRSEVLTIGIDLRMDDDLTINLDWLRVLAKFHRPELILLIKEVG